jgi:hypothetical protein
MGKGLPGGRRQAGRIDYRIEPRSSLLPDRRPRRARGGIAGRRIHVAPARCVCAAGLLLLRWSQLGALRPAELRTPHCCSCVAGSDQYGNGRGGCYCDLAGKLVTQEEEER